MRRAGGAERRSRRVRKLNFITVMRLIQILRIVNLTKMFHVKHFGKMPGKTWAAQDRSRRAMRLDVSQRAPPIV
jgi:hypothetical protein